MLFLSFSSVVVCLVTLSYDSSPNTMRTFRERTVFKLAGLMHVCVHRKWARFGRPSLGPEFEWQPLAVINCFKPILEIDETHKTFIGIRSASMQHQCELQMESIFGRNNNSGFNNSNSLNSFGRGLGPYIYI